MTGTTPARYGTCGGVPMRLLFFTVFMTCAIVGGLALILAALSS